MKLLITISAITATLFLAGCSSSYQMSSLPQDDVYYNPYTPEKEIVRTQQTAANSTNKATTSDGYIETSPDSSKKVDTYDDYYAYEYSSRIRRFHTDYYYDSYYHDYYTNRYWYGYDPFYFGTSIYVNTYPWHTWGHHYSHWHGYPWYGYGYNSWMYTGFYGYSGFGYPYYGYYSSPYAGWYGGYYGGWYGGYYGGYYSNTNDPNSNYYYARRDSYGSGSGLGQSSPSRRGGMVGDNDARKDEQRRAISGNEVRRQKEAAASRTENTRSIGTAGSDAERTAVQERSGRAGSDGSTATTRTDRLGTPASDTRSDRQASNRAAAQQDRNYVRPSEREGRTFQKPIRYNTPNYAKPRSSREYNSPGSRRTYNTPSESGKRYDRPRSTDNSRGNNYTPRKRYVRPTDTDRGRSYNRGSSRSPSGSTIQRGSSSRRSSGVSRGSSSSRRSSGSTVGRSSRSSGSSVGRSSGSSSSRSSGSRSSGGSRRSSGGGGRN